MTGQQITAARVRVRNGSELISGDIVLCESRHTFFLATMGGGPPSLEGFRTVRITPNAWHNYYVPQKPEDNLQLFLQSLRRAGLELAN